MGKVQEHRRELVLTQQLQPLACSLESHNGLIKKVLRNPQPLKYHARPVQIEHIMPSKYTKGYPLLLSQQIVGVVDHLVGMNIVMHLVDIATLVAGYHHGQVVVFAKNQCARFGGSIGKALKLMQIFVVGAVNIDMVPGNAAD